MAECNGSNGAYAQSVAARYNNYYANDFDLQRYLQDDELPGSNVYVAICCFGCGFRIVSIGGMQAKSFTRTYQLHILVNCTVAKRMRLSLDDPTFEPDK